jgi:6-phosphofructokinase 1
MKLLVNCGGGDAPGLNAVIRAVTLASIGRGWEPWGIRASYGGLLEAPERVRGITVLGGTILGTTNRGDPFAWPVVDPDGRKRAVDRSDEVVRAFRERGFGALVSIGGDGSLGIAHRFHEKGVPVVGVPKTIDNDLVETDVTFGFDTAVAFATDALGRLHPTAESHERVMVCEVMGRHAGWIALHAGVAATADVVLIPEIDHDIEKVAEKIRERERRGRRFAIVVVAEGAKPRGGELSTRGEAAHGRDPLRLGGAGERVAKEIEARTGKETRTVVLGHLQRGGTPTAFDRGLALRFGAAAVRAVAEGRFGHMVALAPPEVRFVPLAAVAGKCKRVPLDCDLIATARALGTCLGD